MSVSSDQPAEAAPLPVRVLLPNGEEITGSLWARRQLEDGWVYLVSVPVYRNVEGGVEPAEYRMWLDPRDHVRPVEGVEYGQVPTERLVWPSVVDELLDNRRPSGWVLQKLGGRRGPGQAVVHAVDCEEAPPGAPVLSLDRALNTAERPGVRLCTWCGAAAELDPVLQGFGHEDY
ncbi:DUF6233 domain-containing protein [Streptomyces sp. NPDC056061]|uniref:DUF6233 domain-containing protein n=1 Tax=Streptomyces sp. NPDC056061 TaxID=3345700 RepID=UPI0035D634B6